MTCCQSKRWHKDLLSIPLRSFAAIFVHKWFQIHTINGQQTKMSDSSEWQADVWWCWAGAIRHNNSRQTRRDIRSDGLSHIRIFELYLAFTRNFRLFGLDTNTWIWRCLRETSHFDEQPHDVVERNGNGEWLIVTSARHGAGVVEHGTPDNLAPNNNMLVLHMDQLPVCNVVCF